tara:strand:- start:8884 stop:9735 length:852 start_codon:yes stop_codon:yes gene_type:complete
MSIDKEEDRTFLDRRGGVAISFLLGAGLVALLGLIPLFIFGAVKTANEFGDSFGFINAVVSGLAFSGVLLTLHLQRREMREQREELRRSATAQEHSEMAMAINNYSSLMVAISSLQPKLDEVSELVKSDSKELQRYLTLLSQKQQLEIILQEQQKSLAERGYSELRECHKAFSEIYGPMLNMIPIQFEDDWEEDLKEADPDFYFFLFEFERIASSSKILDSHDAEFALKEIRFILNKTSESKVIDLDQRKRLKTLFERIFSRWHLQHFGVHPHEFKRRQPKDW